MIGDDDDSFGDANAESAPPESQNQPTQDRWKHVEELRRQIDAPAMRPQTDSAVTLRGRQFSIRIEVYIFTAFVAILHRASGRRWKLIFDSGTRGYEIARETVEARQA